MRGRSTVRFRPGELDEDAGHNLVWAQNLPDWIAGGKYSSAQTASILQDHINTVVGHYKGQLVDWDVVNEAVSNAAPYGLAIRPHTGIDNSAAATWTRPSTRPRRPQREVVL